MSITTATFANDPHAATYVAALDAQPAATAALLSALNAPGADDLLRLAEELDRPALAGIVRRLEADAAVRAVLMSGPAGNRFRQAVGVAVRLKMESIGWAATGRKGLVSNASFFTKAERYRAPEAAAE